MSGAEGRAGVERLAPGLWQIDLHFRGRPHIIAAYLLAGEGPGDGELALVEAGPASTLETLWQGIESTGHDPRRLRQILVTHIHLDHAGAAGALAERVPEVRVLVHEAGARHLIDPARLLASAAQIYGERMEELWGTTLPVPAEKVRVVADGEEVPLPRRVLRALYTPGHARHHCAYHDAATATIFTGDVGGVRLPGSTYVRPPTPPPDLDLEAWDVSLARLRSLRAGTLLLTHFGPAGGVADHLDQLQTRLHERAALIEASLARGETPQEIVQQLAVREEPDLRARTNGHQDPATDYELASGAEMNVAGYVRYLAKRAAGQAPAGERPPRRETS